KEMYEKAALEGFQPFKITNILNQGTTMKSFEVEPEVALEIPELVAGQYITVRVKPENDENLALRHYSLYSVENDGTLKFAVKKEGTGEKKGIVSHELHDNNSISDIIDISVPEVIFIVNL